MSSGMHLQGSVSDERGYATPVHFMGCQFFFGSMPTEQFIQISEANPDALLSTELASLTGADFVIGDRESLEKAKASGQLPISRARNEAHRAAFKQGYCGKFLDWLRSGEHGVSSVFIAHHVTGLIDPIDSRHSPDSVTPRDAADFGRCVKVVQAMESEGHQRSQILGKLSEASGRWRELASQWDELEKLFADELGSELKTKLEKINSQ